MLFPVYWIILLNEVQKLPQGSGYQFPWNLRQLCCFLPLKCSRNVQRKFIHVSQKASQLRKNSSWSGIQTQDQRLSSSVAVPNSRSTGTQNMASQFCGIRQDEVAWRGELSFTRMCHEATKETSASCYIRVCDDFLFHDTSTTLQDSTELTCNTENIKKLFGKFAHCIWSQFKIKPNWVGLCIVSNVCIFPGCVWQAATRALIHWWWRHEHAQQWTFRT